MTNRSTCFLFPFLSLAVAFMVIGCSPLKTIRFTTAQNYTTSLQVMRSAPSTLEGSYERYHYEKLVEKGYHKNGKRDSTWWFLDVNNGQTIEGRYQNGHQVGLWKYKGGLPTSANLWYTESKIDSMISYFPSGHAWVKRIRNSDTSFKCTRYYKNGQVRERSVESGPMHLGARVLYFNNGQLHRREVYNGQGVIIEADSTFDANGKLIEGGKITNGTGRYISYQWDYDSDSQALSLAKNFSYQNFHSTSRCFTYYSNGQVEHEYYHRPGEDSIEYSYFNEVGKLLYHSVKKKSHVDTGTRSSYTKVDEKFFVNVEPTMQRTSPQEYLSSCLVYPKAAIQANQEGKVYVTFLIDRLGEVKNVEILKGVSEELDNEAIRIVKMMPRWNPGFDEGLPCNVRLNVPIKFMLTR